MNSPTTDAGPKPAKARTLTPEQEAVLAQLSPDNDLKIEKPMPWDEHFQRRILGSLLVDEEFLARSRRFLLPRYWSNEAHALAATVVFDLYDKYQGLPEPFAVKQEFLERIKNKDAAVRLHHHAELECAYEFYVPGLTTRKFIMDKLVEFAQCQQLKVALGECLQLFKEGKYKEGVQKGQEGMRRISETQHGAQGKLLGWDDLERIADGQQEDWIVDQILERSTLTLLSGLPYSGKTTLAAYLIACLATGKPFLGRRVRQVPVLFLNADRLRERIIRGRIARCLRDEGDKAGLRKRFWTPDLPTIPHVVTTEYLADLTRAMHKACQGLDEKGVIIVDPLRTAFMGDAKSGDENDAVVMTKILAPLRAFARETGWSVMVLHHNSRTRNEYAGNAAVAANTDALWNMSREEHNTTAELYIKTRDGTVPPLYVTEDATGLTTVDEQEAQRQVRKEAELAEEKRLAEFMAMFPIKADNALSLADVESRTGEPRKTLSDRIRKCERAGRHPRLEHVGKGTKTDPRRYFRC
jgi:hypothetical protein